MRIVLSEYVSGKRFYVDNDRGSHPILCEVRNVVGGVIVASVLSGDGIEMHFDILTGRSCRINYKGVYIRGGEFEILYDRDFPGVCIDGDIRYAREQIGLGNCYEVV